VNGGLPSLHSAFEALQAAKSRHASARPHRALARVEAGAYLLQALVLPALLCGLLLRCEPLVVDFWREFILTWSQALELPLRASSRGAGWGEVRLVWSFFEADSVLPSRWQLLVHALVTAAAFAGTFAMPAPMLPLKYVIRVLCVVHATALAFFAAAPAEFPYDIPDHILAMTGGGFVLLMTVPIMLALGYYMLHIPLATKVFHSLLILGYFIVLVPLEVVAHAALLRHLSTLVMPLLFFGFGALLNFALFIALYSWAASTVSEGATAPQPAPPKKPAMAR
jgi:hypothetical protein